LPLGKFSVLKMSASAPTHAKMLTLKSGQYLGKNQRTYDFGEVVVSETEYHQKVFEGWHSHENCHLTLIISGGNREQRKASEIEASPGKALFYGPGELHRNLNTAHPSKNINVEISDAFLRRHGFSNFSFGPRADRLADIKFALLRIYRECRISDQHTSLAVKTSVLELLSLDSPRKRPVPPWISQLHEILNDRWSETPSLSELADLLQVHPVTISKAFRRHFSCTLGEYLRKLKVEKALALMSRSRRSLAEVAYACGFADQSHFIRSFKAVTGFRPSEYRRF
jgi:AraC family transcriptional regulator